MCHKAAPAHPIGFAESKLSPATERLENPDKGEHAHSRACTPLLLTHAADARPSLPAPHGTA